MAKISVYYDQELDALYPIWMVIGFKHGEVDWDKEHIFVPISAPFQRKKFEDFNEFEMSLSVTMSELIMKTWSVYHQKLLFTHFPNLSIVPIDNTVAERAAYLRGTYTIKTPDALIVSTAIVSTNATVFMFEKAGKLTTVRAPLQRTHRTILFPKEVFPNPKVCRRKICLHWHHAR